MPIRFLIVGALFGAVMQGDDITVPLGNGSIFIHAEFIRHNSSGVYVPELAFTMRNQTSSPWRTLKLEFDIGGLCNGEPRQWTLPVDTGLGWTEGHQVVKNYTETLIPLYNKVDGCNTEIIKVRVLLAESFTTRIVGVAQRVDFEKQLQELKTKREAEAAARAEKERRAAEVQEKIDEAEAAEQAKKDAAEAARQRRLAVEQKKKRAEAAAWYGKTKADAAAKAAEERREIRAACAAIYKSTADTKIKDLTVKEEQQVRACQVLGLYPPRD